MLWLGLNCKREWQWTIYLAILLCGEKELLSREMIHCKILYLCATRSGRNFVRAGSIRYN